MKAHEEKKETVVLTNESGETTYRQAQDKYHESHSCQPTSIISRLFKGNPNDAEVKAIADDRRKSLLVMSKHKLDALEEHYAFAVDSLKVELRKDFTQFIASSRNEIEKAIDEQIESIFERAADRMEMIVKYHDKVPETAERMAGTVTLLENKAIDFIHDLMNNFQNIIESRIQEVDSRNS